MDVETQRRQLEDAAREMQTRLGPQIEQARQNLGELNRKVAGFIRENPGTCLLGAVAIGFLVGRLASRR